MLKNMKTLNLVSLENSEIKYKISNFPDTQKNITIELNNSNTVVGHLADLDSAKFFGVTIKSRMSWEDLQIIICAVASLRELGIDKIHLYVPYFLGARSDRQFEEGGNRYLKDVICPIINSLKLDSVTVLDPHSSVLENLLNNFKKIDNSGLFREAMRSIYGLAKARKNNDFILISPDAGATHKIYKLAQDVDYKGEIITCSKERDKDGKLTRTNIGMNVPLDKDIIIVDDICDGGATFINITKEIKTWWEFHEVEKNPKIYLIVTHGIFSKGFDELSKYFDSIYTTNSYGQLVSEEIGSDDSAIVDFYITKNTNPEIGMVPKDFVKQLNIF